MFVALGDEDDEALVARGDGGGGQGEGCGGVAGVEGVGPGWHLLVVSHAARHRFLSELDHGCEENACCGRDDDVGFVVAVVLLLKLVVVAGDELDAWDEGFEVVGERF